MNSIYNIKKINSFWNDLYGNSNTKIIEDFLEELKKFKSENNIPALENEWYKDVTVYSIYVDLFNVDFQGLENKLDYLKNLGVSCLWLLPILDSPGRDAGFDIKDYKKIRPDLLSHKPQNEVFDSFLKKAHSMGINVIFDIAVNHTSDEHPWFLESKKSKDNPYRDYYIWSKDDKKFKDARIIFYGIEDSNWKKEGEEYFFHRFFDFQPDLNFRNPQVLIEMSRNFLYWLQKGVDGFRVDAIPYLWKEENTSCENLDKTHTVVKFFRAVIDYVRTNTLMLAEACQKPDEVVKYFGKEDECHAGYHFPLMPQIYKSIGMQSAKPIVNTLSRNITPEIPNSCQWFTFLRCHDELSLELVYVTEEDRKYIHDTFCKKDQWDFRLGQGISSRLAPLMDNNIDKIALIYSIMMTLPGTPVVYYGDEFGKQNDHEYYKEQIEINGKDDTRFLVRGRVKWNELESELQKNDSFSAKVFGKLSSIIKKRSDYKAFGRGEIVWHKIQNENDGLLCFQRIYNDEKIFVIHNLKEENISLRIYDSIKDVIISNNAIWDAEKCKLEMNSYSYIWFKIK